MSYNYKLLKVSKRVAIILLIAVFSVAGFVSCKKQVTEPSQSSSSVVVPGNTGPVNPTDPENPNPEPENPAPVNPTEPENPSQPTFPANTYYTVYAPFRNGVNYPTVSYQDTNALLQLWKDMIGRKDLEAKGGSKRWFIRDNDNKAEAGDSSFKKNNYYFFDKNFDLVYYKKETGWGYLRIRKLVGAVIVKYFRGKHEGTYTIAGLYENLIDGPGRFQWDNFSKFMHAGYDPHDWNEDRKVGDLELLVLNTGLGDDSNIAKGEYGVQSYYNVWNHYGYRNNKQYFLGRSPEFIDNIDPRNTGLNQKVDLTYSQYQFRFVTLDADAWELSDHSVYDGWHQRAE